MKSAWYPNTRPRTPTFRARPSRIRLSRRRSDDLLEPASTSPGLAEPGVVLPSSALRARDVRHDPPYSDACRAMLKRRKDGRRVGAGRGANVARLCVLMPNSALPASTRVSGRGVVVRQDRDVQPGVLEVALLECNVQTGVVRVRGPVECEPNGPVGSSRCQRRIRSEL